MAAGMRRGAVGKDEDMEAYSSFAEVYDIFQDNVPYEEWCSYVTGLLREQGVERGLVLDLGCGTGSLTGLLAEAGYDMIGICLLYTSPSPRDGATSRMPSSA